MKAQDLLAVLAGASELALTSRTTYQEFAAARRKLAAFDNGDITLLRWSGQSPWERHCDGDELFYVLEGKIEITLLSETETLTIPVAKGSVFVMPRGRWYRTAAHKAATLTVRATGHGRVSFADNPRYEDESTSPEVD